MVRKNYYSTVSLLRSKNKTKYNGYKERKKKKKLANNLIFQ